MKNRFAIILVALFVWNNFHERLGVPSPASYVDRLISVVSIAKTDRVTYVFEKDDGTPPPAVMAALNKLNREGIVATAFEDDTRDGNGNVPEQYKVALEAAQKYSLPALVVQAGTKVKATLKPTTESEAL